MRQFAELYRAIDASTSTTKKVQAMVAYFRQAPAGDAAWAAYFLSGAKPRQVVPTRLLRELACELAGIEPWLFEECYAVTGDLAEAIAYLLPPSTAAAARGLQDWIEADILPLKGLDPQAQREQVARAWQRLDVEERFLHVKLIGGAFRVGVSKLLLQRALAEVSGLDPQQLAQRMMGAYDKDQWPSAAQFQHLLAPEAQPGDAGQPYPFFLAHALEPPVAALPEALGPVEDWIVEWKYDGIRAQVVKRQGRVWIWSRGEELITDRFPEVVMLAQHWPNGSVLDGEILAWREGEPQPLPFAVLQRRIGRTTLGRKLLAECPATFVAYDLLEHDGQDLRAQPQHARRTRLEAFAAALPDRPLRVSPRVQAATWTGLAEWRARSRERAVEGLMLKHRMAAYGSGRTRQGGVWWKWKIEPLSVDAVLIYAQAGHGRRANVYTDYTFAVWNRPPRDAAEAGAALAEPPARHEGSESPLELVPFAKAYSGLTDAEFKAVDRIIRKTTVEKFGPVRKVLPTQVFELGFEGISRSTRHKSGIATRFPRMLRWRTDKPVHEADSMPALEALLQLAPARPSDPDESGDEA